MSGAEIESTGRSPVTAQRTHGPAVLPDAESLQLVHGAGGSLSDPAGQPLGTAHAGR